MNILIPHTWLLEHLDTKATPQEIQKIVSLCGPSIERIYEREGEAVYDIEVTTNRVDSFSVRGIAREAAVILSQAGKRSKLQNLQLNKVKGSKKLPLPTIIDDQKICKRTLVVVLSNVERAPTPDWMAKRLLQTEMNVHDAVIDITNYITHELGHPCHAFDYDKIMELGGMIIIKLAEKGKKFTTLDGVEYTTVGGEVVFENDKGEIIDLPAIKGTANTSINESTKSVLFWIENIDAKKVRFASMTHAIRTTAAQINEKNVDPELGWDVFVKGIELFQDLCHAQVASEVYDNFPGKKKPATVSVRLSRISEYLGVELSVNTIGDILEKLGCSVRIQSGKTSKKHGTTEPTLEVTPPTFRPDIQIPADVIEEVARIYGYHNLPSVLMPTAIPLTKPEEVNFSIENRVKRFLSAIGWQELYTYSMVSEEIARQSGFSLEEHLKIQNYLTDDRVYMRRSLIPSLEEVLATNSQRIELSVFEIANVYHPHKTALPDEQLRLTLVSNRDYRHVKGDLETLLESFYIDNVEVTPAEKLSSLYSQLGHLSIDVQKTGKKIVLGTVGVLKNGHTAIDLDVTQFLQAVKTHPTYQPLPKTNVINEDLTFTLPEKTAIGHLLKKLDTVSPVISSVTLKDVYGQNYTIAVTYHDPQKHLIVEEIAPIRKEIVTLVEKESSGKLVGKV